MLAGALPVPAEEAIAAVKRDGITQLVVLPLYPQFSVSTSGSSLRLLERLLKEDPVLTRVGTASCGILAAAAAMRPLSTTPAAHACPVARRATPGQARRDSLVVPAARLRACHGRPDPGGAGVGGVPRGRARRRGDLFLRPRRARVVH